MKKTIFFILINIYIINIFSQETISDENQIFRDNFILAEEHTDDGNFHQAIKVYNELLVKNPENANLMFKIGFCYLNTAMEKEKSVEYLEKAVKSVTDNYDPFDYKIHEAPREAFFYLGKAYHFNHKFDKAIEIYNDLKSMITDEDFVKRINREIEICGYAKELVKHPINMIVANLGANVNSPYSEHSPLVSADETILIFTSKREGNTGGKRTDDGQYFEDIYATYKINNEWIEAQPISDSINTLGHEASIGISPDGRQLYIYKDDNGDGNIYYSKQEGLDWTVPVKLGTEVNTKAKETHASLSAEGDKLYFTSNRKGGYGGLDIYITRKLPDGTWGKAQNLGTKINTPYDEEGPFIHYDGITLFFSSKGHKSMGAFDIFSSTLQEDNTWTEPSNIGYPINTTDDDVFYWVTPDGRRAYYASHQQGSIGDNDIYIINLPESHVRNLTVLTGIPTSSVGDILLNAEITVTDKETGDIVGIYKPDPKSGQYMIIVPRGKVYEITINVEGYAETTEDLKVPEEPFEESQEVIKLKPVELVQEYYINQTILFGFDKFKTPKSQTYIYEEVLDILAIYMNKNPNCVIEIGGHTDAIGSNEYNMILSEKRAGFVKNYLLNKGVKNENIVIKGYSEDIPIAINENPDGSDSPEGRKFNRRITFKIIKEGKEKLIFKPIGIPDQYSVN
ncbi:MAG: PD40 domain-containing protein [Bacteroidales bacterium]|nr:PD40 domain-containing protein [Bacteroidales bacterium]